MQSSPILRSSYPVLKFTKDLIETGSNGEEWAPYPFPSFWEMRTLWWVPEITCSLLYTRNFPATEITAHLLQWLDSVSGRIILSPPPPSPGSLTCSPTCPKHILHHWATPHSSGENIRRNLETCLFWELRICRLLRAEEVLKKLKHQDFLQKKIIPTSLGSPGYCSEDLTSAACWETIRPGKY